MNRTNRHNTQISTNLGDLSVEFDVVWSMDNGDWYISHVDLCDYDNETIPYDTVVNRVIEYATYNCDPFGGSSDEEIDYVD